MGFLQAGATHRVANLTFNHYFSKNTVKLKVLEVQGKAHEQSTIPHIHYVLQNANVFAGFLYIRAKAKIIISLIVCHSLM